VRAVVVGSGQSAKGFIPPAGVVVIAVNGAIDWLVRANHFFTLDPSAENLHRLNHQRIGVQYHYAYSQLLNLRPGVHAEYYQRITGKPFENPVSNSPQWWANRLGCKLGLSKRVGQIHTGNSAWGALGLALHLGAEKVALVGVDANASPRIGGGYSRELCHLPLLFESAIGQINFINCGAMQSAVPTKNLRDGMEWLCN